ncbi:RDD family protein [Ferruginivarius sediminum]|uniref:RDD family protein n=1 Tax=Ferruginivarius sediminum TaxID=2661937 RepID=UPI00137AD229|nr:RDD family protein [Ferruginivarius sediminum]
MASRLPSTSASASAWQNAPPDPLDAPELYEGLLWRRVAAHLVDACLIVLLGVLAWFVLVFLVAISFGALGPLLIPLIPLFPSLYAAATIGGSQASATPGMRLFGLTVLDWTGRRVGYAQGFLMAIFFYVTTALTSALVLIVALFTQRHRTLHDIMAGTVVVRRTR